MADFMLDLQEDDFQVVIFDIDRNESEGLKWVKFIRRHRPKTPLIVLCEDLDKESAALMYQESIVYLGLYPLDREVLLSVISSVLRRSHLHN